MKKNLLIGIIALLSSCTTIKQIGDVTMLASRNIDSKMDYVVVRSYMGGSKKEIRQSKRLKITLLEDAINKVVKETPGGEFLKNVKIYLVDKQYIAIEGDVWGRLDGTENYRGFKKGDFVLYTNGRNRKGELIALKNDKICFFQEFGQTAILEVGYTNINKIEVTKEDIDKYIEQNQKPQKKEKEKEVQKLKQ